MPNSTAQPTTTARRGAALLAQDLLSAGTPWHAALARKLSAGATQYSPGQRAALASHAADALSCDQNDCPPPVRAAYRALVAWLGL